MPPPDLPPTPPPATPPPVPAKKSNTLVIILCVILGLIVLAVGSCVAVCSYGLKKAKSYAEDSQKNPKISALALAAAFYPGVEVVAKDLDAGTIVLKNKKTGETLKLDSNSFTEARMGEVLDQFVKGKPLTAVSQSESTAAPAEPVAPAESTVSAAQATAQTSTLKKFPADFPVYTDGGAKTLEAAQQTFAGVASSRQVFQTSDSPETVADYFGKKLTAAGYAQVASENGSDEHGPTATSLFQKEGGKATFNLTAHIEDGKTHVEVNLVQLK